jgi:hypothetical protein
MRSGGLPGMTFFFVSDVYSLQARHQCNSAKLQRLNKKSRERRIMLASLPA